MANRRLRIDHLVVRMRGVSEPQARELVTGLGEAVLRRLNEADVLGTQMAGSQHIQRIDTVSIELSSRDRIAGHLADAITASIAPRKGEH